MGASRSILPGLGQSTLNIRCKSPNQSACAGLSHAIMFLSMARCRVIVLATSIG
jgi:hypothetical protein